MLITGPSGPGKSDLALRLLDRGFALVSDDQTLIRKSAPRLTASAPPTIRGKLENRGTAREMEQSTTSPWHWWSS